MNSVDKYPVSFEGREIGFCSFSSIGLYIRVQFTCPNPADHVLKLMLIRPNGNIGLGIPLLQDGSLYLDRKISVRSLGKTESFSLELRTLEQSTDNTADSEVTQDPHESLDADLVHWQQLRTLPCPDGTLKLATT